MNKIKKINLIKTFFIAGLILLGFFTPASLDLESKTFLFNQSQAGGVVSCSGAGCKLNDFAITAVKIARWLLGVVGSLALLMFIYGGVMLLISGGNQQRVEQGRQILTNAVIGLVVVFLTYMIISFVVSALGAEIQDGLQLKLG